MYVQMRACMQSLARACAGNGVCVCVCVCGCVCVCVCAWACEVGSMIHVGGQHQK